MMLAQTTEPISGTWAAAAVLVPIVCVQVGRLFSDYRKDKRDAALDAQKAEYLKSIADSNQSILIAQGGVKNALEAYHTISTERHKNLLDALERLPCTGDKQTRKDK